MAFGNVDTANVGKVHLDLTLKGVDDTLSIDLRIFDGLGLANDAANLHTEEALVDGHKHGRRNTS